MGRPHHTRRNSGRRRRDHGSICVHDEHVFIIQTLSRAARVHATVNLRGCPSEARAREKIANALLRRSACGACRLQIIHGRPDRLMWRIACQDAVTICEEVLKPRWVHFERVTGKERTVAIVWGY